MNNSELKAKIKKIKDAYPDEVSIKGLNALELQLDLLSAVTAKSSDIKDTKTAVNELKSAIERSLNELATLSRISKAEQNANHEALADAVKSLVEATEKVPTGIKIPEVPDTKPELEALKKSVEKLKLDPKIDVKSPEVKIELKELKKDLKAVTDAVKAIKIPEPKEIPETDLTPVVEALKGVEAMVKNVYERPIPVPQFGDDKIVEAIETNSGTNRQQIDDLSFSETLTSGQTFETSWVDVSTTNVLDVTVNIGTSSSVSATVSYTDAADPNTTPPGVDDVTRSTSTTIAGSALGGIDEVGFSLPAQMKWAKISVTDLTGGQDIDVSTFSQDETPSGAQLPIISALTDDFKVPVGRNITVGKDPDNDYVNMRVNGTRVSDSSEDSGSLPSGATPAYDPINTIVASNVIDTGWLPTEGYVYNNFRAIFNVPGIKMFIIDASDDQGNNSVTTNFNFPTATSPAFGSVNVSARLFQAYFRVIIFNDTGTTATNWAYRSTWLTEDNGSLVLSLDQPILDFFPAPITQTITKGRQPDGDYVATPADGLAFETSATLGASGTYTSDWYDTDGFKEIELYITSDVVSGTDGIEVEFTDDAQATTPTVFPGPKFTYDANAVVNGFTIKTFKPALDGFRIKYTNGGTVQGSFFLSATLKTNPTSLTQTSLTNDLDQTNLAVLTRAGIWAENDAGQIANITRSTDTGALRVSVTETEAGIDIAPLETWSTNQSNVSTTATQIVGTPLTGRKSVLVKNLSDSTKTVFIGTSSSVTASSGYELAAGEGVTLELSPTGTGIWAISSAGTNRVCWLEIA